jgi:hypothetical protein
VVIRFKDLKPMHINAIAFDTVDNMTDFMEGLYQRKVRLWSVSFINPKQPK